MIVRVAQSQRGRAFLNIAGFASAVFACIALPALVVGAQIDSPPAAGELERFAAAWHGQLGSAIAEQFELAALWQPPADWPESHEAQLHWLGAARVAQFAGILVISMLVYIAALLARGRLFALASCLGLCCIPAVAELGHVLRPETASTVFGALALVLLQCMASVVHRRRSRGSLRRAVVLVLLAATAAMALGLAVAAMPALGGLLLVPIVLSVIAALQLGLRGLRIGARRGFLALPARAITGRLWAPALAGVLAPVGALLCLWVAVSVSVDQLSPTQLATAMLPVGGATSAALFVLAAIGGLSLVLRTGLRFGRRGRVGADLVLLTYCGTQLAYGVAAQGRFDPLPAAPSLAFLFGEGLVAVVATAAWWRRRRVLSGAPRR